MRNIFLLILVIGLAAVAIATWGSLGSGLILAGLLVGLGYTGWQYYLSNRDDTDWYDE